MGKIDLNEKTNTQKIVGNITKSASTLQQGKALVDSLNTLFSSINNLVGPFVQRYQNKNPDPVAQEMAQNPNYNNIAPEKKPGARPSINEAQIVNFLSTREGQKALVQGLKKVKELFGDVKISELEEAVKGMEEVGDGKKKR